MLGNFSSAHTKHVKTPRASLTNFSFLLIAFCALVVTLVFPCAARAYSLDNTQPILLDGAIPLQPLVPRQKIAAAFAENESFAESNETATETDTASTAPQNAAATNISSDANKSTDSAKSADVAQPNVDHHVIEIATPIPTAPLITNPAPQTPPVVISPRAINGTSAAPSETAPPVKTTTAPIQIIPSALASYIPGASSSSLAAVTPQISAATPKDEDIEKLIKLNDIRTPQAWVRFFINAYFDRDYATTEWCVDFEGTRYQTASLRRDCLYRLEYVLTRLADTQRVEFPTGDVTEFEVRFRTKENIVDLLFTRAAHGHWRISSQSINQIDPLYRALYGKPPLRLHWFVQYLPEWMFRMYFGMTWMQWLFLIGGALGGVVVYSLVSIVFHIVVRTWMKVIYHREANLSRKVWKPLSVIAMVTTWYIASRFFSGLPPSITDTIHYTTTTIVVAMGALMLLRIVDLIAELVRKRGLGTPSVDAVIIPLFSRSTKIIIIFSGMLVVAQTYRWEVLPLLSGMGIGGIAVAFAAKETLANLFGSITVLMDRPFVVGDWIITGNVEGTVEAVGMRSTRIRTFYNSLVTIPNNNLTTATIDNMGSRHFRRYKTSLNIQYDTPPELIEAFCEGVRELIRRHPYTRKDLFHVYLNEFSSASLDILLVVFFICPDTSIEYRERGNLITDILHLAKDLGVHFAFPTQTLHLVSSENAAYKNLTQDPILFGRSVAAKWRPIEED